MTALDQLGPSAAANSHRGARARPLPGTQAQREAIAASAVLLGLLLVVGVWWVDTPGRSLHTAADRLTAAGRITGLAGTYLVLIQVVLMARLPWLDRFIGSDRMSAWHRFNGAYTITLLVGHTILIVMGYAASDHFSLVHESSTVLRSYPDVLAATAALGLLLAVGISSARFARRHLTYESWYALHLYTYLAIALSFSHQFATGNDFVAHPANRVLWAALFALTGALLLGFRVVRPIRNAVRHDLRVSSVAPESPDAVSVYITGRDLDAMRAKAGQFFRWRFITRDRWWRSHPFSLSAPADAGFLRITAKGVGDDSRSLSVLRPGTRVMAEGPYGNFTARRRSRRRVLLIAGGVGITPLRALLEEMPAEPGDLTLLYRAARERDVLFRTELDHIAASRGATLHYLLGRRDKSRDALSGRQIKSLVPDVAQRDIFVCGPPGLVEHVTENLLQIGVTRGQIHSERFEL